MMKKGLSYVDWILSVGLFIIILILIFIIFQPAFITGENKSYLAVIVKDGLESEAFVKLDIYPVFISSNDTTKDILLEKFPKKIEIENTYVIVQNGSKREFDINYPAPTLDESEIIIEDVHLNEGINTIWIINSLDLQNTDNMNVDAGSGDLLNHTIGINEKVSGFYPKDFSNKIINKSYESLKNGWKYPLSNDFQIFVYNSTNLTTPMYWYSETEPDTFASIKTFFYSANSIEIEGNNKPIKQEPVFILIKVW